MIILMSLPLLVCSILGSVKGNPVLSGDDLTIEFVKSLDVTSQLLFDLDKFVQAWIDEKQMSTSQQSTMIMSKNAETEPKENMLKLVNNLNDLDKKLQTSSVEMQNRKRYVLGAMLRQMQNTVRRIRSNVSRMQTQLASVDSISGSGPLIPFGTDSAASTLANKELVDQIGEKIGDISKKINDIVLRLNSGLNIPKESITNTLKLLPLDADSPVIV